MKRKHLPQPRSRFLKLSCECGNIQEIFSHATTIVVCRVCGKKLTEPTGGISRIFGEVIEVLDE
jgi:small subunit ribosomal protein S27e